MSAATDTSLRKIIAAGSRTYTIEIRKASNGARYLVIEEIHTAEKHRVMVFEEYWPEFMAALSQTAAWLSPAPEPPTPVSQTEISYNQQLDELLSDVYGKGLQLQILLGLAGLDSSQVVCVLQDHAGEVSVAVLEMFREYLFTRPGGERLWEIINERYGFAGSPPKTYQAIAEKWGFSRERASQLVEQALRKLRLPQRRRRLVANLHAQAEGWLGTRLSQIVEVPAQPDPIDETPPNFFTRIRQAFPRAYEPWTREEDQELIEKYQNGNMIDELAQLFQRQPGAISSRLRKLNI